MSTEIENENITWEQYQELHPPKPYEQSMKYGDYTQYRINHTNNLFVEYLKLLKSKTNNHST